MYWAKAGIFNIKLIIDLLLTQKKKHCYIVLIFNKYLCLSQLTLTQPPRVGYVDKFEQFLKKN